MTVAVITIKTHSFQVKGETKIYKNVKEIQATEKSGFRLVINKNWQILVNSKYNRIEII